MLARRIFNSSLPAPIDPTHMLPCRPRRSMKHFTILLAIWTSRAFAYHLLNEDDLLSPMCGNIQAAVRVRNEDAWFTIPGNMTRVGFENSLRIQQYGELGGRLHVVGELELEKMATRFLASHGLDVGGDLQGELMRRVLLCYERAPACHQQGDSPALAEDDGDDGADVLFTSVPVSDGCFVSVRHHWRGGDVTGTALRFVEGQGWDSGGGCQDSLCVANRLVCTLRSTERKRDAAEKLAASSCEAPRVAYRHECGERGATADQFASGRGTAQRAGDAAAPCEGQSCELRRVCWTGSEWLMSDPPSSSRFRRVEQWRDAELTKHPGKGGAALPTHAFTEFANESTWAARMYALLWERPAFVERPTDVIFQTHIPHVAELVFSLLDDDSHGALALPGLERSAFPWIDSMLTALQAASVVSRVFYREDFEAGPLCFAEARFRAAAACMGPDVARGTGCTASWFPAVDGRRRVLAVSRVRSAVWSHVGLAHEVLPSRASTGGLVVEKEKFDFPGALRSRCRYNVTIIMRMCNRVFLDPALFRTDVEKHLAHAFRDAPDLSASTCVQTADLEGLSFAEQVSIMVGSAVVVAAHGAALTNIVWMRPKTTVVEVSPHNFDYSSYFGSLAAEVGLRYVHRIDPKPRSICMKNGALDWSEPDEGKRRFTWPPSVSSSVSECMAHESCQRCAKDSEIALMDLNISAAILEGIESINRSS